MSCRQLLYEWYTYLMLKVTFESHACWLKKQIRSNCLLIKKAYHYDCSDSDIKWRNIFMVTVCPMDVHDTHLFQFQLVVLYT
jgi:hypothetical protein